MSQNEFLNNEPLATSCVWNLPLTVYQQTFVTLVSFVVNYKI